MAVNYSWRTSAAAGISDPPPELDVAATFAPQVYARVFSPIRRTGTRFRAYFSSNRYQVEMIDASHQLSMQETILHNRCPVGNYFRFHLVADLGVLIVAQILCIG